MYKKISRDKWKHLVVGIGMGAFLQGFFVWIFKFQPLAAGTLSFLCSIVVSYGFELFSLVMRKGHYEVMDAVASMIGASLGIGVMILVL